MTTRELVHEIKITHLFDQAAFAATQTSPAIDTQGWESLLVVVDIGVWTAGTFTYKLQECTTSGGAYADVDASQVEFYLANAKSTSALCVTSSAATDQTTVAMSYVGGLMRFVKLVATAAAGNVTFGAIAIQGDPRETI